MQRMTYPQGDKEGKKIFSQLLQLDAEGRHDDFFLECLLSYRERYPKSEKFDLFYAKYAIAHKAYSVALESLQKAERIRPLNMEVWKGLVCCYKALGRHWDAVLYMALLNRFYAVPMDISVPRKELQEYLRKMSQAMCIGNYAPFWIHALEWTGTEVRETKKTLGGEYIPVLFPDGQPEYWVGAYAEQEPMNAKGWLLSQCKDDPEFVVQCGAEFVFDIMRSRSIDKECTIHENVPVILPVAATVPKQKIDFASENVKAPAWLGQWEYSFFRLDRETKISSDKPFVIGNPIPLIHRPNRKKLILQLMVDGLCWQQVREEQYRLMPRAMQFFSKGVIFDQHFSVSEYTYPSLATIETGMYPEHSQIFNSQTSRPLHPGILTLSEQYKKLGYYCCSPMSCGTGIYNGVTRGYDRLVVNSYALSMQEAVGRIIRQIEAFGECDQVISVQPLDTHSWTAHNNYVPLSTQTKLKLSERLAISEPVASVYLPHTPLYQHANRQGMKDVDRALAVLFDYLEQHYDKEEYLVLLYSDHGMSVFDENPWILSEKQVGAAFMLYGAGVPALGTVDELTSTVDIYPSVAKLIGFPVGEWVDGNLPKALGGQERDYVISEVVYPGQPYRMCIRTKTHEFRLESLDKVDEDGTLDVSGADTQIFCRGDKEDSGIDSDLWENFFAIAKKHTESFNNEGHFWPQMRKERPLWFQDMR